MAAVGSNQLKSYQCITDYFNNRPGIHPAGVKFEVVGMDNKLSPLETAETAETASVLKSVIYQDVR